MFVLIFMIIFLCLFSINLYAHHIVFMTIVTYCFNAYPFDHNIIYLAL